MQTHGSVHWLTVAMEANAGEYTRAVQQSFAGDCWDYLILTAANEKQASGYRRELELRQRAVGPLGAFFPPIQKCLVVPDPPGRRAGSGGATLSAVRTLMRSEGLSSADLDRLHILLIHSGGASQRLPMYSPVGKIFSPLPLLRPDGQIATLFDHLYVTLAGLPRRLGPGMLVLAGDVFLLFDHRHVERPSPGVTALTMRVAAEMGAAHGVYRVDERHRVVQTLQKVSVDAMRKAGAADREGRVLIDTGLLLFDPASLRQLAGLAGIHAAARRGVGKGLDETWPGQIDLYDDMTAALARGMSEGPYLAAAAERRALRRKLWAALHGTPFCSMELQGQFLHLGTTRQFRDAMVGHDPSPAAELFQQNLLAHSQWPMPAGRRVFHSALVDSETGSGQLGPGCVVEHSLLRGPCRIGAGSVVSQTVVLGKPIDLPDDLLFFQAPVVDARGQRLCVHVLCGVDDDFKGSMAAGRCLYLNRPIEQFLLRHRLTPHDVWGALPVDRQTLWNARLFPATDDRDRAHLALWLADESPARPATLARWRRGPRYSMADILESADPTGIIEHRERVSAWLHTSDYLQAIAARADRPVESYLRHYSTAMAYEACEAMLGRFAASEAADASRALDQARAHWSVAQLLLRPDHPTPTAARVRVEQAAQAAFARVAAASEIGYRAVQVSEASPRALLPGYEVMATAPVRLDLAGGWSDTPPYCFERGGHVVNLAIDLDDQPPVCATVRTLRQPRLILRSDDLGQSIDMADEASPTRGEVDVRDPFALHRVALGLTGVLDGSARVGACLRRLGVGLEITTRCRVPKGSGLGTSSILAAALLSALHRALERKVSSEQLIEQTLLLEQRLSTGGGWQDQVGGIVGGLKSTIAQPGVPQRPIVQPLTLSDAQYQALEDRLVIYFSGQQRLARDILRRVMGRWLGREPAMLRLMDELREGAARLTEALPRGDWLAAATEIARYWRIKCELYPGSTTPFIDVLMLECREHYLAGGLAGAGGGGFAYFFCRDAHQATLLRSRLRERSLRPGSPGSLYTTRINRDGLKVVRRKATGDSR